MIDKDSIYFNPSTRQFCAGTSDFAPAITDDFVKVPSNTALRIVRKAKLINAIDSFINDDDIECLHVYGDSCLELDSCCECKKRGRWYSFYTEGEMFIPMETSIPISQVHNYNTILVNKSQFRALMLFQVLESYFRVPLSEMPHEDYIEFSFFDDGSAFDGTGVRYIGRMWADKKVHLCPDLSIWENERIKTYTANQKITLPEFVKLSEDVAKAIADVMRKNSNNDYNGIRDMMEDGLVDIYGEDDGWQFNNDD